MNIFVLDDDPYSAARMHCDKHCCKMVIELYQQLGSALRRHGAVDHEMPLTQAGKPLKGGYAKHPCTVWCGESRLNFEWAADHAVALSEEYTYRYGRVHACDAGIRQLQGMYDMVPKWKGLTEFVQAMPDEFKVESDPVRAYRQYYWLSKREVMPMKWTVRSTPSWWLIQELVDM